MGASCTKGSKLREPDKAPYGSPRKPAKKVRQKGASPNKVKGGSLRAAEELNDTTEHNGSEPRRASAGGPYIDPSLKQRGRVSRQQTDLDDQEATGSLRSNKRSSSTRKDELSGDERTNNNNSIKRNPSGQSKDFSNPRSSARAPAWEDDNKDQISGNQPRVEYSDNNRVGPDNSRVDPDNKSIVRPRSDNPQDSLRSSRPSSIVREAETDSLRQSDARGSGPPSIRRDFIESDIDRGSHLNPSGKMNGDPVTANLNSGYNEPSQTNVSNRDSNRDRGHTDSTRTPSSGRDSNRAKTSEYYSSNENDEGLPADTSFSPRSDAASPAFSNLSSPLSPSSPPWSPSEKETFQDPSSTGPYVTQDRLDAVKELLTDLSDDNKKLISQHYLCPNTRIKLIQAVEKWYKTRDDQIVSKVMVITGKPGIGKTCFAAEMCRKFHDYSAGSHFFHFNPRHTEHNLASTALKSLTHSMCGVFPRYLQSLSAIPKITNILEGDKVSEIFDAMMQAHPRHRPRRMIIILDAIDECDLSQRDQLLKVINEYDQKAPNWLFLLVTLDDDSQLTIQLDSVVHLIEVDEKSDAMHSDLKRYFRNYMLPFFDVMSIDGAQTRVVQNCKGKFLAASLLKKKLEDMPSGIKLTVRDSANFPTGLAEIYTECFQRLFDYLSARLPGKESNNVYMDYVGILLLAREPIDKSAFGQLHSGVNVDEALFQLEGCVTVAADNSVTLSHKNIISWFIHHDPATRHLVPDLAEARQKMADHVMIWLRLILEGTSKYIVDRSLEIYAVKHCITHLIEANRQFKNIAKVLCSLSYIDEKLHLTSHKILLKDYTHSHYQLQSDGGTDLIVLDDYMKNFPNLSVQINEHRNFLQKSGKRLRPGFILHQAANFCDAPAIQTAAKYRIANLPWLEDITNFGATAFIEKSFGHTVCDFDISSDSKFMVVLTSPTSKTHLLHIMSPANIDITLATVDLSSIEDRKSNSVKILADNVTAFVGSLEVYANLKTGKFVSTDLDLRSVPLNEPYSVECCDSSLKLLACAATTLPFGGDLLLMLVFDLETRKCVATLEAAKVEIEESSEFGTRACAISPDGTMLCAFVKQSNSFELQGIIWSTFSWKIMRVVTVTSDLLTRCSFLDSNNILISSGVRSSTFTDSEELPDASYLWTIHKREAVAVSPLDNREQASIVHHKNGQVTHVQWFQFCHHVRVSKWKKWSPSRAADSQAMIYGLDGMLDVNATDKLLLFAGKNSVRLYRLSDLEKVDSQKGSDNFIIPDAIVRGISFIPRTEELLVTYNSTQKSEENVISVASLRQKSNGGFQVTKRLIINENFDLRGPLSGKHFTNQFSCYGVCRLTRDANFAVLCTGTNICTIEVSTGGKRNIQQPASLPSSQIADCVFCVLSPKEPVITAVYSKAPNVIYVHDIFKETRKPLELHLPEDASNCRVVDLSFLPTNGQLVSYYTGEYNLFVLWNTRNGSIVNHHRIDGSLFYTAISSAFDRLALSLRADGYESVLLRNSDNSFSNTLMLPVGPNSSPEIEASDIEFTADGTVLLGMFTASRTFRVWNSFNGDTLIDLNMADFSQVEVVGMVTNTHVLFSDAGMLEVCDIGTGETMALVSPDEPLPRKLDFGGLRISQQGSYIVAVTRSGALKVVQVHNISAVKFKTTLQRMDKNNQ